MEFPRTLVIGAHFSEQIGTGVYLGSLFSAWQADCLATVSASSVQPDWRFCHRHFRSGDSEFRLRPPFRWLLPVVISDPVLPVAMTAAGDISFGHRMALRLWRAFLRLEGCREILYGVASDPSSQLLTWVREFKPEVLYGHCSDLNSVRFLRRMQRALGLPLVLHLMDDWPENLYCKGWASRILRPRYLAEFGEVVRSADVVIAICQEMAIEYERRYRRRVLWLPMAAELGDCLSVGRTQWSAGRPFRLRYGGRVGWAIRESLADLAGTVRSLRQEGTDVEFDLVTFQRNEVPAACFTSTGVTVKTPAPLADLPRLQAEADVLVVCYDFDSESFRQARYSMPSKIASCMASGTPILVYGPPGLPVVEYARREGWGKVVDSRDPVKLRAAVLELMNFTSLREQFGRTAQRLASERHDSKVVSVDLRKMLI